MHKESCCLILTPLPADQCWDFIIWNLFDHVEDIYIFPKVYDVQRETVNTNKTIKTSFIHLIYVNKSWRCTMNLLLYMIWWFLWTI